MQQLDSLLQEDDSLNGDNLGALNVRVIWDNGGLGGRSITKIRV